MPAFISASLLAYIMKARINLRRKSVGTPMAATQAAAPLLGPHGGYDPSAGSRNLPFSSDEAQEQVPSASAQGAARGQAEGSTPPVRSSAKRRRESVTKCKTLLGGPPTAKAAKHLTDTSASGGLLKDDGDGNAQLSVSLVFDNPGDGGRRLSVGRAGGGGGAAGSHRTEKRPGTEAEREDKEMMIMDWKTKFTPGEIVIIPRSENRLHYGTVVAVDEKLVSVDLGNNMIKRMPTLLVGKLSEPSAASHSSDIMSKAKTVMHTVEAISHYLLTSAKLKKPIDDNVRSHCVFVLTYQARRLFALLTKQEHHYSTRVAHENHSIDALMKVRKDLGGITGTIDRFLAREQHSSQGSGG
ncbi:hypothetical protein FOZ63_032805 [Perkinsus olseni]|uniref:Uncharacterized protein n=1 Tax=Perkinsus olseni TaxID=32597 RepID=A0A7J6SSW6_PEROL|nr:hypothetical protein FOZ63_032805 [Perkinsus olseni]